MSQYNAVIHVGWFVLKDLTRTIIHLSLFRFLDDDDDDDAFARLRNRRRKSNTSRPRTREHLMDSGEIILAEYQMSGKDCRIIQTRGY